MTFDVACWAGNTANVGLRCVLRAVSVDEAMCVLVTSPALHEPSRGCCRVDSVAYLPYPEVRRRLARAR